ncbi:MAG: export protein FliQ family 3 [Thermoleophilia bacterium]|nr:export protein FliQ family 3 [Thermoleophilia bacterium]
MESVLTELAATSLMKVLVWSAPAVLAGLLVGFMISLFQAVTQIQEQTLTFVPKIIAVFVVILVTGSWMISEVQTFTQDTYDSVDAIVNDAPPSAERQARAKAAEATRNAEG